MRPPPVDARVLGQSAQKVGTIMDAGGRTDTTNGNAAHGTAGGVGTSIDQVRELLFGPHYRELERKLARIDAHLGAASDEMRKEVRRRTDALQTHVNTEIEALTARIEAERAAQLDAAGGIVRETRETIASLEARITRVEETMSRAQRELRQHMLSQAEQLLDEVRQLRDELTGRLEREIETFRDALEQDNGALPAPRARSEMARVPPERSTEQH